MWWWGCGEEEGCGCRAVGGRGCGCGEEEGVEMGSGPCGGWAVGGCGGGAVRGGSVVVALWGGRRWCGEEEGVW